MAPPSNRDIIRYREVRRADQLNDQKTALQILQAVAASSTQEELQEFVLSQIKRIIYGDEPGNWYDDFITNGIPSLGSVPTTTRLCGCLPTDVVGNFVYITGPSIAGLPQVTTVDPTDDAKMPALGIIVTKPTGTTCTVQLAGDVTIPGLIPNKRYFVGSAGTLSPTPPVPTPGNYAYVQLVGIATDTNLLTLLPTGLLIKTVG